MLISRIKELTVGEILKTLVFRLGKISNTPDLDAQMLLSVFLKRKRSWILAHPEECLAGDQFVQLESKVVCLEGGEPLPYILGTWEFFGLEFEVTPAVLIPRPETELLVERAIDWLKKSPLELQDMRVIDVGTGSGCIAISIAVNSPGVHITATDISPNALNVARLNAEKYQITNCVSFIEADLIPESLFPEPYSLILANLPYIPTRKLHSLPVFGREPTLALDGGSDGLTIIRRLLGEVSHRLILEGLLLIEIEASEGPEVLLMASESFPKARVQLLKDLAGLDRLLEIEL